MNLSADMDVDIGRNVIGDDYVEILAITALSGSRVLPRSVSRREGAVTSPPTSMDISVHGGRCHAPTPPARTVTVLHVIAGRRDQAWVVHD